MPTDVGRFVDVLLARNFTRNFGGEESAWVANLGVIAGRHALSGLGVVALLAASAWVLRRGAPPSPARRALAWSALLWLIGNAATIVTQNKVFGTNPDLLVFLLVGALAVVPLGASGVAALERRAGSSLQRVGPSLLVLAWGFVGFQALDGLAASRGGNDLARRFAVAQAAELPAGSVLVVSGNDTAFTWGYLQAVERRRPDLLVVPRV